MRMEIRLAGAGGQGIVLASMILGEAALLEGKKAACFHAYGPESRGGASRADVIISQEAIEYPVARNVDLLLALTQEACTQFWKDLRPSGMLIVDGSSVPSVPHGESAVYVLPIVEVARRTLGTSVPANVVALGAISALTGVVGEEALEEAIASRIRPGALQHNLRALRIGFELARGVRESTPAKVF
ncbi:MAG: 2-oxoacid:acceptor oxidoreductase family protein [Armatimonadota bacterium]|nr:2-oxoacid:acceptor oxidoreductase family protein [Armatimonadota bacterium]